MPTFTASLDPLDDDAVLVLVAMVEVVDIVTEAAAGAGEAELVTEEMVEDNKVEVVVMEEVVEEDEVDELVVVTELPNVVKIEMEPARKKAPFPVWQSHVVTLADSQQYLVPPQATNAGVR
ncbi:uncharacterized protein BHQ10_000795 [Talaromyces amestolkiae]|uniref:Uncharacterized protein n=1 Tax=Talaromyces amestolkiae TaxID=1196081 RepID=A0A364KML9_TALAM|nr:uncharacterized protein BHQ10_000795 [Talaromyces amestolkiae]RAO64783.1 hypothetical protein BHQ10_000795 [Talaromyces amestolkiae]